MANKTDWTNVSTTPQSLDTGQVLAPGESGEVDMRDPHNQALRDAGHLIRTEQPDKEAKDR